MPDAPGTGTPAAELTLALPVLRPPGRRGRAARTLTARAVLLTCLVALVSVVVTALVALPLTVRASNVEARTSLVDQTTLVVALLNARPNPAGAARVAARLRERGLTMWLIQHGQPDHPGLPARFVTVVATGHPISGRTGVVDGQVMLIEGRVLGDGTGDGVILAAPAQVGLATVVWNRLGLALLAGLLAGALAGTLLARRLARPIRRAAHAAGRLSAGDRSVRVPPEGPAEAEDLAHALNDLAAALSTSEGRQRDFLLSVSHELRTPLTTLRGYAEALADGVVGPDGAQRAGQTMLGEAQHLDRLVMDLLALARLEAADFPVEVVPVDVAALIRDAAQLWGGRCAAVGVVLRAEEIPAAPVPVQTDPGRLRQIVDGLMENALRVVPPRAPLVLAVYPPAPDPAGPGYVAVEVRDGGPGFTDADLRVMFDRGAMYQRYRGVRKVGSGLGLALAAGLVRRLGGTIEAGHAPEGGARFTVRLPAGVYQTRTSR